MDAHEPIYDVNEWRRLGRGRDFQFFATDDEVQDWLLNCLPQEFGPYSLIGADLVKEGKIYVEQAFEFDISELKKAIYEQDEPRWQYWIISKVLTPELNLVKGTNITRILSFNGLILLHHGSNIRHYGLDIKKLYRAASSIGIVDKVINDATGEVRHHEEYLCIFNSLKRLIKKSLCYSSIHTFKNGSKREDTKLQLMTEKAVEAYKAGLVFTNEPGRKLR